MIETLFAGNRFGVWPSLSVIRQIGTSIAPAIYVGLITSTPGLAGYQHMLFCVALFNVAALITMLFYQPKR